jgi:hypothetical protein
VPLPLRALFCALLLSLSWSGFACDANAVPDATTDFSGRALNDFARIMRSAQVEGCASAAAAKLSAKLRLMSPDEWKRTWSGGILSMALATGLILGAKDELSAELDLQLVQAANAYRLFTQINPHCGFHFPAWTAGNTCLEDYAIAAQAHGWRTAYYRLTGREWLPARQQTAVSMKTMLNDQINCIVDPDVAPDVSGRGPCTGNPLQLSDDATIVTLNHGVQNPAYGVGQMTALAVAAVGLEVAREPFRTLEFGPVQRDVAMYLFREGNEKALPDGSFGRNCVQLNPGDATFSAPTIGCWDTQKEESQGYRADMFPVAAFYAAYGLPMTLAPGAPVNWTFTTFNDALFGNPEGFYGAGRYESYYTMPNLWLDATGGRPPMHGRPEYRGALKRGTHYVVSNALGTPSATATTRVADTTFVIHDLNGANLVTGDPVAIQNGDGWYWQAAGGGGSSITASAASPTGDAIFTIVKISADHLDPIAHDDLLALRTANGVHYVTAREGGGVGATSTAIIVDEQFRLERRKTE